MGMKGRRRALLCVLVCIVMALGACGGEDATTEGPGTGIPETGAPETGVPATEGAQGAEGSEERAPYPGGVEILTPMPLPSEIPPYTIQPQGAPPRENRADTTHFNVDADGNIVDEFYWVPTPTPTPLPTPGPTPSPAEEGGNTGGDGGNNEQPQSTDRPTRTPDPSGDKSPTPSPTDTPANTTTTPKPGEQESEEEDKGGVLSVNSQSGALALLHKGTLYYIDGDAQLSRAGDGGGKLLYSFFYDPDDPESQDSAYIDINCMIVGSDGNILLASYNMIQKYVPPSDINSASPLETIAEADYDVVRMMRNGSNLFFIAYDSVFNANAPSSPIVTGSELVMDTENNRVIAYDGGNMHAINGTNDVQKNVMTGIGSAFALGNGGVYYSGDGDVRFKKWGSDSSSQFLDVDVAWLGYYKNRVFYKENPNSATISVDLSGENRKTVIGGEAYYHTFLDDRIYYATNESAFLTRRVDVDGGNDKEF